MSNHNQNLINKVTVNSIINTYKITKTMKNMVFVLSRIIFLMKM